MHIKDRVVLKRVTEGLNKSLLFQDCDQEFLHCVAENAVLKTLPPGGEVAGTHIKSSWIHVILRGYCEQKSFMTGDSERENITVLKPGDAFPVVEALSEVFSRSRQEKSIFFYHYFDPCSISVVVYLFGCVQ